MESEINLQVGSIVYSTSGYHGMSAHRVDRITKTMAFLESGTKLRLPFKSGRAIGSTGYGGSYYSLPNPVLDEQFKRQQLLKSIKNVNWSTQTNDLIQYVLDHKA